MYRLLFIAAVLFLGRYAFRSLDSARTAAILNRLFWVCYSGWAALVLYGMVWTPLHTYTTGHATLADIDWNATAAFTPPPLSSYKGDAPEDQSSGVTGRAQTDEFGGVAVAAQPPAKKTNEFGDVAVTQPKQAQQGQYTAADVLPDQPASKPAHPPVNWTLASSLFAMPLLLWVAVIFIATGRPVWRRANQS